MRKPCRHITLSLVYLALASCTYITVAPPDDASSPQDAQPYTDSLAADAAPQDAAHDAMADATILQRDASQRDVTPQSDALTQTDVLPQSDTIPQSDAACGLPFQPCCGNTCLVWPVVDRSADCDLDTLQCVLCGVYNTQCCHHGQQCRAPYICIYFGNISGDTTDYRCRS
jgi:hypothetical protein